MKLSSWEQEGIMTLRLWVFLTTTGVLLAMLKVSTAKQTAAVSEAPEPINNTDVYPSLTDTTEYPYVTTDRSYVTTRHRSNCPTKCFCPSDSSEVKCTGGRIALPNIPGGITTLTYTDNRVPNNTLYSGSLKNFSQVYFLDLSNNGIKFIDTDAFSTFENLTSLVLDGNPFVRAFYDSFLWPVSWSLQNLSVRNVVASLEAPNAVWRVFKTKFVPGIRLGGIYMPDRKSLKFPNLQRLSLGNNGLRFLDITLLKDVVMNSQIELLSFAHNNFVQETVITLWAIFDGIAESKVYLDNLKPIPSEDTPAPLVGVINSVRKIYVDMTYNNITGFSDEILHHSQTIWTKHRSSQNRFLDSDIEKPQVKLLLEGNPMDCSCTIKTAMHFLFEGGGKVIISDWDKLACDKPPPLRGLTLLQLDELQIHYCHSDWGEKEFKLTPAQLAFIVICGTVLALVSIMVGYLNRSKFIAYWTFLKNCGNSEEDTVKWHAAVNKYSIPSDHRGIGHKGYYCEEQVTFDLNGSEGNVHA